MTSAFDEMYFASKIMIKSAVYPIKFLTLKIFALFVRIPND